MGKKTQIATHDLYNKLGETISFDLIKLKEKKSYDSRNPHRHSYYEIFLILDGGGTHEVDLELFDLPENSLHFVSPGQVHWLNTSLGSHGFVILFSHEFHMLGSNNKDLLYELPFFNNNSKQPILSISGKDLELVKDLFIKINDEFQSENVDKDEMIRSYLNALLIHSKRSFIGESKDESDTDVKGNELIRKFRTLVEQKFIHEHSVSEYAKLLFVTANHLTEKIQKGLGKSASEVIHDRIILEAKRLLYHSDHGINEIANELNFEDPSYFSKFFKKRTNSSPGEYRSKIREKYRN